MNLIDRMVNVVNPVAGYRRALYRAQTESLGKLRKYEGAATGRRTDSWLTRSTSSNVEIRRDLIKLRDRHRDLARNNPWVARAIEAVASNTIGTGIMGEVSASSDARLNALWREWSETTACDADGMSTLYGLQERIMRAVVESGEVLIRRRFRRSEEGLPVPMQLQVMEPDLLDLSRTEPTANGGRIINGVEFNVIGQRTAYWMFRNHPGDSISISESRPVPASEIAHVYRMQRPGQVRGVPWGAPAMLAIRDLDEFEDAYLYRQKIANCTVGVVSTHPDFVGTADADGIDDLPDKFEPGSYERLRPGEQIDFNNPAPGDAYGPYTRELLYRFAATYGISFQMLTGILTDVNFSSGRMGWLEAQRNIDGWRHNMIIPQGMHPVGRWFLEAAELRGVNTSGATFSWTPPQREMLDPVKETIGMVLKLRGMLCSPQDLLRKLGNNPDDVLSEIQAWNEKLDEADIISDADPRRTTASGVFQELAKQQEQSND